MSPYFGCADSPESLGILKALAILLSQEDSSLSQLERWPPIYDMLNNFQEGDVTISQVTICSSAQLARTWPLWFSCLLAFPLCNAVSP